MITGRPSLNLSAISCAESNRRGRTVYGSELIDEVPPRGGALGWRGLMGRGWTVESSPAGCGRRPTGSGSRLGYAWRDGTERTFPSSYSPRPERDPLSESRL